METYSSGEVCEVAGIPPAVLHHWAKAGLLGAEHAAALGHGNHRRFTKAELLALAVGMAYRRAAATYTRVAGVVKFMAGCTMEWIEAELADGRSFPCPATLVEEHAAPGEEFVLRHGIMVTPPRNLPPRVARTAEKLDVKNVLADVQRRIEAMQRKAPKVGPGRKRGTQKATA